MDESRNKTTGMIYHQINITAAGSAIAMELTPPGSTDSFDLYVRHLEQPTNSSYNFHKVVSKANPSDSKLAIFVPGSITGTPGIYFIGLRPIVSEGV